MRIRWRGLELPGCVVRDEAASNDSYGQFTIEPFEQGFGTTIGNSLRRVLLSSLRGGAVTSVKMDGVSHEFANIEGVLEDVTDIILNIKGVVVDFDGEGVEMMSVERTTAGEVRAGDIVASPGVRILNPDHVIATLTAEVHFRVQMTVRTGRGYATASDNRTPDQELGIIPIDSVFSPVLRVRFRTEDMRVGQRVNYDRLILEIWTDGTVLPEDALVEAGLILRKHLNPLVMYHEMGEEMAAPLRATQTDLGIPPEDAGREELLDKPISALNLSVRSSNCLEAAKIMTMRDLVQRTEGDLLRFRSFGRTSLQEVQHKLADIGLSLGMKLTGDEAGTEGPGIGGGFGVAPSAGLDVGASEQGLQFSGPDPAARTEGEATGPDVPGTPQPGQTDTPTGDADPPAGGGVGGSSVRAGSDPMAAYTMDD